MAIKNLTSLFPLIFLSKHISLYALCRLKWILDIVWPLNQHFNLKNQKNWRTTFFMLRFLIGIICILLHRPKKLTLATTIFGLFSTVGKYFKYYLREAQPQRPILGQFCGGQSYSYGWTSKPRPTKRDATIREAKPQRSQTSEAKPQRSQHNWASNLSSSSVQKFRAGLVQNTSGPDLSRGRTCPNTSRPDLSRGRTCPSTSGPDLS